MSEVYSSNMSKVQYINGKKVEDVELSIDSVDDQGLVKIKDGNENILCQVGKNHNSIEDCLKKMLNKSNTKTTKKKRNKKKKATRKRGSGPARRN